VDLNYEDWVCLFSILGQGISWAGWKGERGIVSAKLSRDVQLRGIGIGLMIYISFVASIYNNLMCKFQCVGLSTDNGCLR
jgi:hypothetical protein